MPGVFGALHEFRKKFANPILKGREPTATAEERAKAEAGLGRLGKTSGLFFDTLHFFLGRGAAGSEDQIIHPKRRVNGPGDAGRGLSCHGPIHLASYESPECSFFAAQTDLQRVAWVHGVAVHGFPNVFLCGEMEEKLILLGAGKIVDVARQKLAKWEFVCIKKQHVAKWEE